MEIKIAEKKNLIEVLYIIRECSHQLIGKGVRYWNNSLVDYNDIAQDIEKGFVYLSVINQVSVGTITIKPEGEDPATMSISRLAIYPAFQKRGLAREMLDYAVKIARQSRSHTLKGFIPIDDQTLCVLLEEQGFVNKGCETTSLDEYRRINFEMKLD